MIYCSPRSLLYETTIRTGHIILARLSEFLFLCWPFFVIPLIRRILSRSWRLGFATSFAFVLCLLFWFLLDHNPFEGLFSIPLCHWGLRFRRVVLWLEGVWVRNRDRGWRRYCPGSHCSVDKVDGQDGVSLAQFEHTHSLKLASSTPSSSFRFRSSSS